MRIRPSIRSRRRCGRTAPAAGRDGDRAGSSIRILRFDPRQPEIAPHWQTYELQDAAGMTLFIALSEIREKLDPSLQFDFVCRAGICGSCAMLIDGRPGLACKTLTKNLGAEFTLAPLPVFAADRRPLGRYRQLDARHERAPADAGSTSRSRVPT